MSLKFTAVRACSIGLLLGDVLSASDVTAGNGSVVDWRHVKSGATLQEDADAFDTALLFVELVGPEAAIASAARHRDLAPPPPEPRPEPIVTAYALGPSGRSRGFDAGPFRVLVQPHENDAAHAAFAEALARAAVDLAAKIDVDAATAAEGSAA